MKTKSELIARNEQLASDIRAQKKLAIPTSIIYGICVLEGFPVLFMGIFLQESFMIGFGIASIVIGIIVIIPALVRAKTHNIRNKKLEYQDNKLKIASLSREQDNVSDKMSSYDEVIKLKKLLDEGVITQEEFDEKKKKLI